MTISRLAAATAGFALVSAAVLSGCAPTTPVVAPITKSTDELQGSTIELPLNTVLDITTGSLATDSYTAKITDTSIVEFTQGKQGATSSDLTTDPGLKPLKVGSTQVVLTNAQGRMQAVTFTVNVVAAP